MLCWPCRSDLRTGLLAASKGMDKRKGRYHKIKVIATGSTGFVELAWDQQVELTYDRLSAAGLKACNACLSRPRQHIGGGVRGHQVHGARPLKRQVCRA